MAAGGKRSLRTHRQAGAILVLAALVLAAATALATAGSIAHAASFGQIGEPWGTIGTGQGQLSEPTAFGVDPLDGSAYVGDTRAGSPPPGYRLQKFSSSGVLEGTAVLPGFLNEAKKEERVTFRGAAVDHADGLVYVLEQCTTGSAATPTCSGSSAAFALALRVFKTTPSGGELVPAANPRILLPTSAEDQIRKPVSIAVDPVTHGVVILGQSLGEHKLIERIGPTGSVEARFEDSTNKLVKGAAAANALVIGRTGTVYTLQGNKNAPGAERTRLWELPQDLSSLAQVPGFAAAAEAEAWNTGAIVGASPFAPELALSPDGKSVYWKEGDTEEVVVRDFSLATNSTTVVFGGGKGRCQINSTFAGLGVWGEGAAERLLVLDQGTTEMARNQVIAFGQGGSGCPTPVAKFKINGSEADGTVVQAESPVEFNAASSELGDGEAKQVTWNFGDGSEPTVLKCPEPNGPGTGCEGVASLKTTHEFEADGEFTVSVEIELVHPTFGNPAPASHTLKVEGGAPPPPAPISVLKAGTGTGTVTSSPGGINCGSTCAGLFEVGQTVVLTAARASGSEFAGWSGAGCSGTGACTLAGGSEQSVTARFESQGPPPSEFELSLLTDGAGTVTSSPAGIACGSACHARFDSGATVTLTATPTGTGQFLGWSGACSGTAITCSVLMDETRSVEAGFSAPGQTLVVSLAGDGAGAVKSARPGINCGLHCESSYKAGTVVALFPEAAAGSEFVAWGGACAGSGLVCELKMSGPRSVIALFAHKPTVVVSSPAAPTGTVAVAASAATPTKEKGGKKGGNSVEKKLAKCKRLKAAAKAKCVRRVHRRPHQKRNS